MKQQFKTDIEAIRTRARQHMDQGAVTHAYQADREQVLQVLNEVLATEIVCVLRYRNHYHMAVGTKGKAAAAEFLEHAQQEEQHADWVAHRITQLGGKPNFNPTGIEKRAHAEYVEGDTLRAMVEEDLVAERIAIETYSEVVRWLGDDDPTTRVLVERILEQEEEHADDMMNLLDDIGATEDPVH
jgi:bacterioferritin